MGFSCL